MMLHSTRKQNEKSILLNSGERNIFRAVKLIAASIMVYCWGTAQLSLYMKSLWVPLEQVVPINKTKCLYLDKTSWRKILAVQFSLTRLFREMLLLEPIWGQFKLYIVYSSCNEKAVSNADFLELKRALPLRENSLKCHLCLGAQLCSPVGKTAINIFYCFYFPPLHWSSQPHQEKC